MNTDHYLEVLKKIIFDYSKSYSIKVYLYGSRAKATAHRFSDIDIAILPLEPLPDHFISTLKDIIEESTIPYFVDVVDLSKTDTTFQKKVLSEGIEWKD